MIQTVSDILKEIHDNRYRLFRLAVYELKKQNSGTLFGFLWNFFNPMLQIFVYWFVFSIGMKVPVPYGGYPYILWMIVGIMPWFYFSLVLSSSCTVFHRYAGVLKRMSFPLAVVPVISIMAQLMAHLLAMAVVIAVIYLSGYSVSLYTLQIPYFLLCGFVFLCGYSYAVSAITVVFRDFQKIMASVIRLLFYVTPIVWAQDKMSPQVRFIFQLNPLAYLVDGYRESLLYGHSLLYHWKQGIYFWCFSLGLFMLGCHLHGKLRKQFIDLI